MSMPFTLPKSLIELGFRGISPDRVPRLIVASEAHPKKGKTHWACCAPGPVCMFNTDQGEEGVADKLVARGKKIVKYDITVPPATAKEISAADRGKYELAWGKYKEAFIAACNSKLFRTIVTDTHSDLWATIRLARFGKLTQVLPEHYPPVTAEFEEITNYPKKIPGLNAVYIHKLGKEYKAGKDGKRGEWTGGFEAKGCGSLKYIASVNIEHYRTETGGFGIKVKDNRENPDLDGLELTDEMCSFSTLAQMMFPETTADYWE